MYTKTLPLSDYEKLVQRIRMLEEALEPFVFAYNHHGYKEAPAAFSYEYIAYGTGITFGMLRNADKAYGNIPFKSPHELAAQFHDAEYTVRELRRVIGEFIALYDEHDLLPISGTLALAIMQLRKAVED